MGGHSLDTKPVKLSDEIVLLYLDCIRTRHGKQVLVAVVVDIDGGGVEDDGGKDDVDALEENEERLG